MQVAPSQRRRRVYLIRATSAHEFFFRPLGFASLPIHGPKAHSKVTVFDVDMGREVGMGDDYLNMGFEIVHHHGLEEGFF
jgi:hypothetical protein